MLQLWEMIILTVVIGLTVFFFGGALIALIFKYIKEREERSVKIVTEVIQKMPEMAMETYKKLTKLEEESKNKKNYEAFLKMQNSND